MSKFEIRRNGSNGTGLFATKRIKRGQQILFENPYTISLYDYAKPESHTTPIYQIANIAAQLLKDNKAKNWIKDHYNDIAVLQNTEIINKIYDINPQIKKYKYSTSFFEKLISSIRSNIFTMFSFPSGMGYGTGLWENASFINHRCLNPNCKWIATPWGMSIVAVADISIGEELTHAYSTGNWALLPSNKRKKYIEKKFGFECECKDCITGYKDDVLQALEFPNIPCFDKYVNLLFTDNISSQYSGCNLLMEILCDSENENSTFFENENEKIALFIHLFLIYGGIVHKLPRYIPKSNLGSFRKYYKQIRTQLVRLFDKRTSIDRLMDQRYQWLAFYENCDTVDTRNTVTKTNNYNFHEKFELVNCTLLLLREFQKEHRYNIMKIWNSFNGPEFEFLCVGLFDDFVEHCDIVSQ